MEVSGDGVRPGPDPFLRAEVVHSSDRTRVTRLFLPGRTVIRKEPLGPDADRRGRRGGSPVDGPRRRTGGEPLGPDADRRARHEVAMLERLRGVTGVVQLAQAPRSPGSVVLEDAGETSL